MMDLDEAIRTPGAFKKIYEAISRLTVLSESLTEINKWFKDSAAKKESDFIDYQYKETTVDRVLFRDRVHPVDSVIINNFNAKTGNNLEEVKIVYGPSADEYTRSYHALALAAADKIYFRNGSYKPETEEGQKLLAHELTHIAQNKKKSDYRNVSVEQKEAEAEINEQNEEYNPDPIVTKKIGDKEYSLKKSVWKQIHAKTLKEVEEKIESKSGSSDDSEYLNLLLKYEKWLKQDKSKWEM